MDKEFLYDMLRTPSVSGHEIALQKKVIQHMEPVADEILTDATGDVISVVNPHAEAKVLLCGHIDEIGFLVTDVYKRQALSGRCNPLWRCRSFCFPRKYWNAFRLRHSYTLEHLCMV